MFNSTEQQPLKKHSHPFWLYLMAVCIVLACTIDLTYFMCFEASYHRQIGKRILFARQCFREKRYMDTIVALNDITISSYLPGKILMAKSLFALSDSNHDLYLKAHTCLQNLTFNKELLAELKLYVPKKYHEDFDQSFTKA